jgi:hypothetical protein
MYHFQKFPAVLLSYYYYYYYYYLWSLEISQSFLDESLSETYFVHMFFQSKASVFILLFVCLCFALFLFLFLFFVFFLWSWGLNPGPYAC